MSKRKIQQGIITFKPGLPMQLPGLNQDPPVPLKKLTNSQKKILHQVGSTVKAYLDAGEELLDSKFSSIRDLAPAHFSNRGNVIVVCCEDGILIRYEQKHEEKQLVTAWVSGSLTQLAPSISENSIYCYPDKNFTSAIPTTGVELTLSTATDPSKVIAHFKIGFEVVLERPPDSLEPPNKPYCLLSVRNYLDLQLFGELVKDGEHLGEGQKFLSHTQLRLPVGWEAIEIFRFINLDNWKPEFARIWAENDILASVMTRQLAEKTRQSLDPRAAARKQYHELLKEFENLLKSDPKREEILQVFLKNNPRLLCPTYIKVWPKLSLLGLKATDFVFREADGDYLLVEIEKSIDRPFLKNGDTSKSLKHAEDQITDWKQKLEDNLSTVQRELGLTDISTSPKFLIVIGRTHFLTAKNRRKLVTLENHHPKLKIMTYDDVLVNAKAVIENFFGPLWDVGGNTEIFYID